MPLDPITSAIISSVIGSAVQEIANAPGPVATVPAVGIPRILPEDAKKGELMVASPTSGSIDGQPVMLAPGVQIRDPFNMMVLPGMLQGAVPVRYQTDVTGAIAKVWILSQQEAARR